MDQYEEITLSGDDKPVQDAVKRANKALEGHGDKAVAIDAKKVKSAEETEAKLLAITSKSANSRERLIAAAERAAAGAGRNSIQQLMAERDLLVSRLNGDEARITRAKAAFEKRISVKQYEQLFDEADRRAAQSAAAQAAKQTAYNDSLNAAVKASQQATKGTNQFEAALRQVNEAQREAIASNQASIAALERRNALIGKTGIAKIEAERGFALQDFGKTPADAARINASFNQQRDTKQLELAIKASNDAAKGADKFQQALVGVNRQQQIAKQTAYDDSLKAAQRASQQAAAAADQFEAALRKVNKAQREATAANQASIQQLERRSLVAGKTGAAKIDVERGFAIQDLGKTPADIAKINASFDRLKANVNSGSGGFIQSAKNWATSLVSVALAWQVIQSAVQSVRALINQSRDFAELGLSLGALFNNAEAGKKVFGDLVDIVREFPRAFNLQSIGENAKLLAAFKFSAAEVPEVLRKVAGAAILGEDRIQRLLIAAGQIKSKGVLQAEEALQFAEAGVEVYGTLAKAAGVTELQIRKLGEKGFLRANAVLPVILNEIEKTFSGAQKAVDNQTRTIEARLKVDVLQAAVPIGNAIDSVYAGALRTLQLLVPAIRDVGVELRNSGTDFGKWGIAAGLAALQAIDKFGLLNRITASISKDTAAKAADAKQFTDELERLSAKGLDLSKPGFTGFTKERAVNLLGKDRGEEIAFRYKLLSIKDLEVQRAKDFLRLDIAAAQAVGDREKAQKKALENAKDNAETLAKLRADEAGSLRLFLSGSKDQASVEEKILNVRRQMSEKGAGQKQIEDAVGSIKRAEAYERLAEGEKQAGDNLEILIRLRTAESGALKEYLTGAREQNQLEKEILTTREQLTKNKATPKQLEDAEAIIRRTAGYKEMADTQRRADEERIARGKRIQQLEDTGRDNVLQQRQKTIEQTRDLELAQVDALSQRTVAERVSVTQKKLAIEINFQASIAAIEDQRIANSRDKELRYFQELRETFKGDIFTQTAIDAEIGRVTSQYEQQRVAANQAVANNRIILETQAASQISQIQIDEQQRVFEFWKSSFSKTIDALFSTTKSFGERVKSLLTALIFAPMKEAAATLFASLVTGQSAQSRSGGGLLQGIFGVPGGNSNRGGGTGAQGTASIGAQFALGAILGGPNGTVPVFNERAPGGTGTFTGAPVPGLGGFGGILGGLGGLGGGAGSGGAGGAFGNLKAQLLNAKGFLTQLGNLGRGTNVFANPGATPAGFGGVAGGAALLGGGALVFDGLRRGGLKGLGETTAGGALIGAKFGGPVGALIGAGVGATAGFIRLFIKGATEKAQREIKSVYGIDVTEKNVIKMVLDIAKQSYGGNLAMAVRSQQVAELIQLYGMSTGKNSSAVANIQRPVLFLQRGGQLFQQAQFAGNNAVSFQSPVPSITPTQVLPNGLSGANITVQMDGAATREFLQGQQADTIQANPGIVAKAASTGLRQNTSRGDLAKTTMAPLLV